MDKLKELGYELTYSGQTPNATWGRWWVHTKHPSGRVVYGYGADEVSAINAAIQAIEKPLDMSAGNAHK